MIRIFIFFTLCTSHLVEAQLNYPTGVVNVNTTPGVGIVEQIQNLPKKVNSSLYIDDNWSKLLFSLAGNEQLYEMTGRIDLLNDRVELSDAGTIKSIQGQQLSHILVEGLGQGKRYFIRNRQFENYADVPTGFYEVMNEGEINVLKYHDYLILEPSYNAALDVGSRSPEIRHTSQLYLMKERRVALIPRKRKDIFNLLGTSAETVAKAENLDPKKEVDLMEIVNRVNETLDR